MAFSSSHNMGRADLSGAFMEFSLEEGQYVGPEVAPKVGVSISKGYYPAITRESHTLENNIRRAPDGGLQRISFQTEDKSYKCQVHGVEVSKDDEQVLQLSNNYGIPVDEVAAMIAWHQVMRQHESRVAALFQSTTLFTSGKGNYTDVSGSNPWATVGSDLYETIQTAQEAVHDKTGVTPMDAVMSYKVFNDALRNTGIRGDVSDSKDKTMQALAALLAPMLGLSKIHVAKGVYNNATGSFASTFAGASLWNSNYVTVFANNGGDLTAPRMASTIVWEDFANEVATIDEYRDESKQADIVRCQGSVEENIADELLGHLLKVA